MTFLTRLQTNCHQYAAKTALEFVRDDGVTTVSYQQLEHTILRTMGFLRAKGVQEGDRVALQLPKSVPFIYLHLAVMRLGAISLPLNPGYPAHELRYFLQDAEAKLLLADKKMRPSLMTSAGEIPAIEEAVFLDALSDEDFDALISAYNPAEYTDIAVPQDLSATCLMIYTSGTTGRPKGAELTHGNLTANINSLHQAWDWQVDDVLLHILPLFHIHGLLVALHGALNAGATTVLLPRFDPQRTLQLLCDRKGTVLMGVPAIHRRLVNLSDASAYDLSNVRLITSGSDRLPDDLFCKFRDTFGHVLLERYGMSETGMLISNPLRGERRVGAVGFPLPGVEVRIVRPETEAVLSDGEIGEVQVRGNNVFKGYWRQPQKTADAFTPDGWFRTGDLGLREPDGYFILKGRSRDLIISGGYNIYPSEVELVLAEHPAVQASAVIGCPDDDWGETVVAIVVPYPQSELTREDLISHCKTRLVNYKVPRHIVFADDLPRNSLGKIQRSRLQQELCSQLSAVP